MKQYLTVTYELKRKKPYNYWLKVKDTTACVFYLILSESIRFAYDKGTTKPCYKKSLQIPPL